MNQRPEYPQHQDREDWPLVLTPELREQLIQAKSARILDMMRRQRHNKHRDLCYDQNCECH